MSEQIEATPNSPYPLVTFSNALELARAVSDAGGARADVTRSVIASNLGTSHKSGSFVQRVASAKTYGMITGRGSFRLSEHSKHYFFPADDADKRRGVLGFLSAPPVFAEIIKRFDGNRLTAEMLANVMRREMNVPTSWNDRVANFFLKAAAGAGVIDSQGFLRFSATQQSIASGPVPAVAGHDEGAAQDQSAPPNVTIAASSPRMTPDTNIWVFSLGGQSVRVETSNNLSIGLWRKLKGYVEVLKPNEEDEPS
ncbi:MAG: hypothetical protein V7609_1784 [Verrucomicrobiota bacterium]